MLSLTVVAWLFISVVMIVVEWLFVSGLCCDFVCLLLLGAIVMCLSWINSGS